MALASHHYDTNVQVQYAKLMDAVVAVDCNTYCGNSNGVVIGELGSSKFCNADCSTNCKRNNCLPWAPFCRSGSAICCCSGK